VLLRLRERKDDKCLILLVRGFIPGPGHLTHRIYRKRGRPASVTVLRQGFVSLSLYLGTTYFGSFLHSKLKTASTSFSREWKISSGVFYASLTKLLISLLYLTHLTATIGNISAFDDLCLPDRL
jgi:hypothetical protein